MIKNNNMKVNNYSTRKKEMNLYIIIGTLLAIGTAYYYLQEDNKYEKLSPEQKLEVLTELKKYEIDKKNSLTYKYLGFSGIY